MSGLRVAAAVLALAACQAPGPGGWTKKAGPADGVRAAERGCQRWAERKHDEEYDRTQALLGRDGELGRTTYQAQMTAFEAQRRQRELFAVCMESEGYRPRTDR